MNINIKNKVEQRLTEEIGFQFGEWVDIYITPLNRIDITIVKEEIQKIDEDKLKKQVLQVIAEMNVDTRTYSFGFFDIYTPEQAEDFGIVKEQTTSNRLITWADAISLNYKVEREQKNRPFQFISFYSYKGGVGRTTALVQTAYSLAKEGKRVVLIDLDIEAPSLHRIFEEQIQDTHFGVKHGLVDYLFEKTISVDKDEHKIRISDIFIKYSPKEFLEGEIYVLPATKFLNSEYIFKLTQLQSSVVHENKYLDELLEELQGSIDFDIILIDSRTGLNQWGAFSLLGYSDQVVFVAYPNEENVEGLKSVIELMNKAGLDNYVVAMSKIEPSTKGLEIAKTKFGKLDNINQEFIGIPYNPDMAMAGELPVPEIISPYQDICNYLLENRIIDFNSEFISKVIREDILNGNFKEGETIFRTDAESKILRDRNTSVIIGIDDGIKKSFGISFKAIRAAISRLKDNGNNSFEYKYFINIVDSDDHSQIVEYYNQKKITNITRMWFAYISYLVNNQKQELNDNEYTLKGIDELVGKGLYDYYDKFLSYDNKQILDVIRDILSVEITQEAPNNKLFETFKSHDINFFFPNVDKLIETSVGKELLIGLIECIKFFRIHIQNVRVLLFINNDFYDDNQEIFYDLKGNIQKLEWNENDLKGLIKSKLKIGNYVDYINAMYRNKNLFSDVVLKDVISDGALVVKNKDGEEIKLDFKVKDKLLDLLWGIRIEPYKYSTPVSTWIYNKLNENKLLSQQNIITIINNAIKIELSKPIEERQDRFIRLSSIEESIRNLANEKNDQL